MLCCFANFLLYLYMYMFNFFCWVLFSGREVHFCYEPNEYQPRFATASDILYDNAICLKVVFLVLSF